MKTTVEIADALLTKAKRVATDRGWTLRMVVEDSLRSYFSQPTAVASGFRLQHSAFGGPETATGLPSWPEIRDVIYNLPPDAESK